jgi:hypothetical protein
MWQRGLHTDVGLRVLVVAVLMLLPVLVLLLALVLVAKRVVLQFVLELIVITVFIVIVIIFLFANPISSLIAISPFGAASCPPRSPSGASRRAPVWPDAVQSWAWYGLTCQK